jgi:rhodanese-related sulfurtransferase
VALGNSEAGASDVVVIDDVGVKDVWERLSADPASVLVDVRTRAEWSFVGVPDLAAIGRKPMLIEYQGFPDSQVDPQFADKLGNALEAAGVTRDSEIFFICRSGGRSKAAAKAMAARGYTRCRNVADGFEGPLDPHRHRGRLGGWKAADLPWAQG